MDDAAALRFQELSREVERLDSNAETQKKYFLQEISQVEQRVEQRAEAAEQRSVGLQQQIDSVRQQTESMEKTMGAMHTHSTELTHGLKSVIQSFERFRFDLPDSFDRWLAAKVTGNGTAACEDLQQSSGWVSGSWTVPTMPAIHGPPAAGPSGEGDRQSHRNDSHHPATPDNGSPPHSGSDKCSPSKFFSDFLQTEHAENLANLESSLHDGDVEMDLGENTSTTEAVAMEATLGTAGEGAPAEGVAAAGMTPDGVTVMGEPAEGATAEAAGAEDAEGEAVTAEDGAQGPTDVSDPQASIFAGDDSGEPAQQTPRQDSLQPMGEPPTHSSTPPTNGPPPATVVIPPTPTSAISERVAASPGTLGHEDVDPPAGLQAASNPTVATSRLDQTAHSTSPSPSPVDSHLAVPSAHNAGEGIPAVAEQRRLGAVTRSRSGSRAASIPPPGTSGRTRQGKPVSRRR